MKKLLKFLFGKTIQEIQCDAVADAEESTRVLIRINAKTVLHCTVAEFKNQMALMGDDVSCLRFEIWTKGGVK